ncbi:MAG: hypothetical protein NC248_05635 [Bacteroides sp.]|nr:hypothetical protein [Bacteroides sp.]MCM1390234.1 hypothetical protein [Bacteroides sp.]
MPDKKNIILIDCKPDEILSLKKGCEEESGLNYEIVSAVSNLYHGSTIKRLLRYFSYFSFPFSIFLKRKKISTLIGWQQFHAINFAFYCALFHVSTFPQIVVVNFTYKDKKGLIGRIYKKYFSYVLESGYINKIHVPSHNYANKIRGTFKIPEKTNFIVTPFGIPDNHDKWSNLKCDISDFALSLGRSNRDFDFLVDVWGQECLKNSKLVIISDTWHPSSPLPANIIHLSNITVGETYSYIANCYMSIVSIKDSNLCSGDTVLLNSMMMAKPVIITAPSTLSEMYINDGVNGLYIPKIPMKAAEIISSTLNNKNLMSQLSENGRNSYLKNFSRLSMGHKLVSHLV